MASAEEVIGNDTTQGNRQPRPTADVREHRQLDRERPRDLGKAGEEVQNLIIISGEIVMAPARRMNTALQNYQIGRMLAGTRIDSEVFDVRAHIDSSLHFDENARNIRQHLGIGDGRDRGTEQLQHQQAARAAEHQRRLDTLRQTGRIQNAHNRELDRMFQAFRPGKRISASGHRYYERRENRSDRGRLL